MPRPASALISFTTTRARPTRGRSISETYCHTVKPPDYWKVGLKYRLYLGHYHEFHYVSTRPL